VESTRWAIPENATQISYADNKLTAVPDMVKTILKFDDGMIYEAKGRKFALSYYVIDGYPFSVTLSLDDENFIGRLGKEIFGIPEAIKSQITVASKDIIQNIKVPENAPYQELEATEDLNEKINLQAGWNLVKASFKTTICQENCFCDQCDCWSCI
jgi:hypothetical protein